MKAYGIPVELIPLTDTGNVKTTYLRQWIKVRKILDANYHHDNNIHHIGNDSSNDSSISSGGSSGGGDQTVIECPGSHDVVFRPGTSLSCHPGNARFRGFLETLTVVPSELTEKMTQSELAERVIEEITRTGGRFLRWEHTDCYWTELHDPVQIHTKVFLSMRDFKYRARTHRRIRQLQTSSERHAYLFCQDSEYRSAATTSKRKRCNDCNLCTGIIFG